MYQVSELIAQQEALKDQVQELTAGFVTKDVELVTLKAQMSHGVAEGPGLEELSKIKEENAKQALEIKSLTQQLVQAYQDSNVRMKLLLQSFAPKPSAH